MWGTYWGQSELSQLGTVGWFSRTLEDIPGGDPSWIGKPVTHLEIRVVDADGPSDAGRVGELMCRTPSVMLGYFKDPERTAAVFPRRLGAHRRHRPRRRRRATCSSTTALKDMIKSGGFNVSSQEVERVLHAHPDVLRAAVVGLPDDYWSEAVTAFVIVRPGSAAAPDDFVAYCRAQLASYKVPKAVHLVEALPVDARARCSSASCGVSDPVPLAARRRVTPEQIVDAAAALFAREGYHAVGTRDIADELGIRGASLYHHYRSKEEILAAICRRVTAEPVEQTLPLLDDAGTPGSRLAALVRAHLHHLVRRRVEFLVGLQELAALTPEHRAEVEEHRRHYQRRVRDTVAAGVRSGEFTVDDPGFAALALLDALNGTARWLRPDGPRSPEAVAEVYVRLLVDGLLGRSGAEG